MTNPEKVYPVDPGLIGLAVGIAPAPGQGDVYDIANVTRRMTLAGVSSMSRAIPVLTR